MNMREANRMRDESTARMFVEVLDRLLEAQLETYTNRDNKSAMERRNRHRQVLIDVYRQGLESNSNMVARLIEIGNLTPLCPNCSKPPFTVNPKKVKKPFDKPEQIG